MRKLVFLDLDDTLFQSHRKCPPDGALHPVARLRDGSAHSFMTGKQRAFWDWLAADATLVPTTARDLDALRRVDLPFQSWSILVYGGVLLDPSGSPDPEWLECMRGVSNDARGDLLDLLEQAQASIQANDLAARVRLVGEFGLPFYFVAKYRDGRDEDLAQLDAELIQPWLAAQGGAYRVHRNDNNLAVIPRGIGKEHAVRHLIDRLSHDGEALLTIGIGDSLIDGAFIAACDYCITPRDTQLFAATFGRPLL
ncbi:MAG: haloacid dehalogenase [Lamprobacter sp.]|uniref:haloacid dehalogenase n=1 Tax=Lamprobacter sp. TaxID=3100796 RepID=UPI002B2644CF|nr:haloacid dehalogenase [Lamprobacter sp.]MEA3640698.1 haloacid dehalogenase [Lamprobacter sp.]